MALICCLVFSECAVKVENQTPPKFRHRRVTADKLDISKKKRDIRLFLPSVYSDTILVYGPEISLLTAIPSSCSN